MGTPMLTFQATVTVRFEDGYTITKCATHEGGGITGDGIFIRPGSMSPGVAVPAPKGFDTLTVARTLTFGDDSGLVQAVQDRYGMRATIVKQPTDPRGNAGFHRPEGKAGVLTGANGADIDPNGTDPQLLTMTFQVDQTS